MKALIVDDEKKSREVLAHFLAQFCTDVEVVGMANGVEQGIALIETHWPDLVFLDIEMPRQDGFELLEHFQPVPFEVIFVTAYEHYAIKALRASAIDYLRKPISIQNLQSAVQRVRNKRSSNAGPGLSGVQYQQFLQNLGRHSESQKLALASADETVFVNRSSILYLVAERAYTRVTTDDGVHVVSKPLRHFEEKLAGAGFFRTHRSYIVNLARIKRWVKREGGYLEMDNGDNVKISPNQRTALLMAFQQG